MGLVTVVFILLKIFLSSAKDSVKRRRKQATGWEKIFAKDTSDIGLLSKIYKELLTRNKKKTNNLIKKWAKDFNRYLTKEDMQMENTPMKRCSASYGIREMELETMKYHNTPIRMADIWNTDNTKCWRGRGATRTLICC